MTQSEINIYWGSPNGNKTRSNECRMLAIGYIVWDKIGSLHLGQWVRVDNHVNSIFIGCVLLRNEKILFVQRKKSLRNVGHKQSNRVHKINRREETKNLVTGINLLSILDDVTNSLALKTCSAASRTAIKWNTPPSHLLIGSLSIYGSSTQKFTNNRPLQYSVKLNLGASLESLNHYHHCLVRQS
ncbi:hypothetical protein Lal_00012480 [Lupinus albus]|nr:hypothetical protein Lal_00012480 [Lupinus albus]